MTVNCDSCKLMREDLYYALQNIIHYDCHREWLWELRDNIKKSKQDGRGVYPTPIKVEEWHTEKHTIWMLLVGMFGDWGTSIRCGWITELDDCIDFINCITEAKKYECKES